MATRERNEQIRKLEAKACYFRWKIRVYDDAFFEYQFERNTRMADFSLKSVKAYEDALKLCIQKVGELQGR